MPRPTLRLASRTVLQCALGFALLLPASVLAAEPSASPAASVPASAQPSEAAPSASDGGGIVIDPTFITTPSSTPTGSVLRATGAPERTPPATDTVTGARTANRDAQGLPLLLLALATISLVVARRPDVRRR